MENKELREKNQTELQKMLASSREKLRDLRFKVASKQLKDIREIREIKKNIARILTILREQRNVK
jgi:large subunit ribosomal protein L29